MKILIDTNVLVSAVLRDRDPEAVIMFVANSDDFEFPRDRKDAKFLSCAVAAGADYFVTGDSDFNEAHQLLSTTILSVSQFKKLVSDRLA
ncbi:MAG: putative toxin-antitoxin system toxin component, PIN family [Desulfuromonadales bacterium]|nr:putative toxin-antitoxin system toxin component, PIN family [Desulfuromonadales bacterium]